MMIQENGVFFPFEQNDYMIKPVSVMSQLTRVTSAGSAAIPIELGCKKLNNIGEDVLL